MLQTKNKRERTEKNMPCCAKSSNSSNFFCNFRIDFDNVNIRLEASFFHVFKLSFSTNISSNGSVRGDTAPLSSSLRGLGGTR